MFCGSGHKLLIVVCSVEVDTSFWLLFMFCGRGHKLLIVVYVCGSGHRLLIVVYVLWKWTQASNCCLCFVEVDTSF